MPTTVPSEFTDRGKKILGAKRDINIKLISKLKSENDMREFAELMESIVNGKKHFLFTNLRNAGPKFIQHPQKW
jgi:hypothetical protein